MKNLTVKILVIIFILSVLVTLFCYFWPKVEVMQIENKIEQANYCQEDSDCSLIVGQCPFGCWLAVNINEVDSIKSLVKNYQSNCVYDCVECQKAICQNNKCQQLCK